MSETEKTKPPLKERLKALLEEYGPVAFVVHFVIFGLTYVGFVVAISTGTQVDGAAGVATTYGGAYAAAKLTMPLRALASLMLTPLVAKLWQWVRPAKK